MAHYWIIVAVSVFIVELLTGTIYLLVLSASLLGAALAAWLFNDNTAMIVAAILSLIGCTWVWWQKSPQHTAHDDNNLDIGQIVIIEKQTPTGEWRVHYRGALWDARISSPLSGSLKIGAHAKIIGHDGNVLIIEPV